MAHKLVTVRAPSRLHFGMLSFGNPQARSFGGIGAMVDSPGLTVTVQPSKSFAVEGALGQRAEQFLHTIFRELRLDDTPACRIEVQSAPPEHIGLGTGTQLGLSLAAAVLRYLDLPQREPEALARLAGRGERSAIGTYGFALGGLLVEAGKHADERLSPLVNRLDLPSAWRFLLLCPRGAQGLWGEAERQAFNRLPPVARETTSALCGEILMHLLPAARQARFDEFSESLFRYGHLAGMCFAADQGGPFAGQRVAGLVECIRSLGVKGVGQSSWGPTVFALLSDQAAAEELEQRVLTEHRDVGFDSWIARPNNAGASIEVSQ